MIPRRPTTALIACGRRLTGLGGAFVIWALGILAYAPELHAKLHHDCCEPQHVCVITLFSQGTEEPVTPSFSLGLVAVPQGEISRPAPMAVNLGAPQIRLPAVRGPPLH